jgi:hypothetical protein
MLRKVPNGYSVKLGGNADSNKMIKPNTPVNFGHKTDFCCVQQLKDNYRDTYYVILHMMEYAQSPVVPVECI